MKSGTILWAASNAAVGRGYLGRESVNETAHHIVGKIIESLKPDVR